jgi:hypothetical protein
MVQKKIEEKRASRISSMRKLPKVNASLAAEYLSDDENKKDEAIDSDDSATAVNSRNKKKKKASSLLQDDRFKMMFNDTDFQVDTTSHEYKLYHPSESNAQKMAKRFEPVQGEEDDEENDDIIRFSNIKQTNKNKKDAKLSKSKSEPKFFELKVFIYRWDVIPQQTWLISFPF